MCVQGSFYSNAVKSLITLSTVVLLGLIIAYHGLQAQVSHLLLSQQLDHCHCHHSSISQLQAIVYQVRQKSSPLKLFAVFSATVRNFSVKFYTFMSLSYLHVTSRRNLIIFKYYEIIDIFV